MLLFILPLLLTIVRAEDRKCYYPDGTTVSVDQPCNAGPGPSACCGKNDDGSPAHCLSNGLCLSEDFKVSRGSCTDASWNASACAAVCTTGTGELPLPFARGWMEWLNSDARLALVQ